MSEDPAPDRAAAYKKIALNTTIGGVLILVFLILLLIWADFPPDIFWKLAVSIVMIWAGINITCWALYKKQEARSDRDDLY